jgi:hypothetical protein
MNKENSGLLIGLIATIVTSIVVSVAICTVDHVLTTSGYENELVIKYHNPSKEYDRQMVLDMVNSSQVFTNFTVKEIKMDRHWIEYRMTNPKGINRRNN